MPLISQWEMIRVNTQRTWSATRYRMVSSSRFMMVRFMLILSSSYFWMIIFISIRLKSRPERSRVSKVRLPNLLLKFTYRSELYRNVLLRQELLVWTLPQERNQALWTETLRYGECCWKRLRLCTALDWWHPSWLPRTHGFQFQELEIDLPIFLREHWSDPSST